MLFIQDAYAQAAPQAGSGASSIIMMVLLIGAVNLLVSVSITLWVALRSRDAVLDNPLQIIGSTVALVKQKPKSLFFPPSDTPEAEKKPAAPGK